MSIRISRSAFGSIFLLGLVNVLVGCTPKYEEVAGAPVPSLSRPSVGAEEIMVTATKQYAPESGQFVTLNSYGIEVELQGAERDRSEYPSYQENPVKITAEEPVSTFSIDVDTSSYSRMRALIQRGVWPTPEVIRTEELINYFDYDYAVPNSQEQPFLANVAVFDSPWSSPKKLVRIGIKGYDIESAEQPDSNIVFLIDVSGSMDAENKLPLVKKSLELLLKRLKPTDTIAIVVYAGAAGVALKPTKVKRKSTILTALNRLSAGGSTAGGEGLALAYQLANENFSENAVNRIILATDGDFNVGQSSNEELQQMVERNRNLGIYLSVLGFGNFNYQDDMMQAIAQHGNGIAAYIDTLQEAKKVMVDQATSQLFPIANDVKIQIEFNPSAVAEYRLLGYETRILAREDFNNDKVDAGEIGAGHTVSALYEITPTNTAIRSVDPLRYGAKPDAANDALGNSQDRIHLNELGYLKLRYKLPGESESRLISQPILDDDGADSDALFAACVAAFAELIRGGKYLADFCFDDIINLATENKGKDENGYRAEFIQLVKLAQLSHKNC